MKLLIVFLVFGVMLNSCSDKTNEITIKHDEEGVLNKPYDGGIQKEVLTEGSYTIELYNELIVYNVGVQSKNYQLYVMDRHGLDVFVNIQVEYAIQKGKSAQLHLQIGKDYKIIMDDRITGSVKMVMGRYDFNKLKNFDIEYLGQMISEGASSSLTNNFIDLKSVKIIEVKQVPKY